MSSLGGWGWGGGGAESSLNVKEIIVTIPDASYKIDSFRQEDTIKHAIFYLHGDKRPLTPLDILNGQTLNGFS